MLLSDLSIVDLCSMGGIPLIDPFVPDFVKHGTSAGLSSFGYDLRLGNRFGIYRASNVPLDPRNVRQDDLDWHDADGEFVLPAMGHCLAYSLETTSLPRNITGTVNDKSTYARCFVQSMNTVLEAGWSGQVTLEITNHLPRPVILRPGEGIVQVMFHMGDGACAVSYADRGGKYMNQQGVTLPIALEG